MRRREMWRDVEICRYVDICRVMGRDVEICGEIGVRTGSTMVDEESIFRRKYRYLTCDWRGTAGIQLAAYLGTRLMRRCKAGHPPHRRRHRAARRPIHSHWRCRCHRHCCCCGKTHHCRCRPQSDPPSAVHVYCPHPRPGSFAARRGRMCDPHLRGRCRRAHAPVL